MIILPISIFYLAILYIKWEIRANFEENNKHSNFATHIHLNAQMTFLLILIF
jgi:hypothetical protein